jgi:outer membrane protein assembly factor BamB
MLALTRACLAQPADWPGEMGPDRSGYTIEDPLITASHEPAVVWKAYVGVGQSPPIVVDRSVYVLGSFRAAADLTDGVGADDMPSLAEADRIKSSDKHSDWHVPVDDYLLCLDLHTGELTWASLVHAGAQINTETHNHASPLYAQGRVVVHTHDGVVAAFDANTGKASWSVDLAGVGQTSYRHKGGNFSSPLLIEGDKIAVHALTGETGNRFDASVFALDLQSGALAWKSAPMTHGFRSNKSSLNRGVFNGVETVVVPNGGATYGFDARTGATLWRYVVREQFKDLPPVTAKWYKYDYVNRLPLISGDVVIDSNWIWYGIRGSRTYAFRVTPDGPRTLWQTPDVLTWTGMHVVREGVFYALDTRYHPGEKNGAFVEPRRGGVGQWQAYDIASGKLLESTDRVSFMHPAGWRNKADPDALMPEGCEMYSGEAKYILAGKTLFIWYLRGFHIGAIGDAGVELVLKIDAESDRPTTPVFSQGTLLLRKFDTGQALFGSDGGNLVAVTFLPGKHR